MSSVRAEAFDSAWGFGPYALLERIASGGIADVYRARMSGPGGFEKIVALKRLRAEHLSTPGLSELLIDEAKIGARLSHGNIVQVLGLERFAGEWAIVLEHVDGVDLARLSRALERSARRLGVDECLHIVKEVLNGLERLHQLTDESGEPMGLVHCDVSPGNVMVSVFGEVKLIDFGIARPGGSIDARGPVGKVRYRAPEQVRAEGLDAQSDLYSTGILLWELLAGERIYEALEPEEILDRASRADVPPIEAHREGLDGGVIRVLRRALHPDPRYRYPHAAAFLRALEALSSGRDSSRSRRTLSEVVRAVTNAAETTRFLPASAPVGTASSEALAESFSIPILDPINFVGERSLEDVLEDL